MKTFYKAEVLKTSEEDSYENGCLPETSKTFGIVATFKAPTLEKLVKELEESCGEKPCLFDVEENRLEIQVMEDEDGCKASALELERFKTGKKRLWLANYSCYISKITVDENIKEELEKLSLEVV